MVFSAKGCLSCDPHKLSRHTSPIPHDALDHLLSNVSPKKEGRTDLVYFKQNYTKDSD